MVFLEKGVPKICSRYTREQPCWSMISISYFATLLLKFHFGMGFSCKFAACFQNTFSRSVIDIPPRSAGTPLEGCFSTWWIYENCQRNWLKIKKMVPFLQEPNFCSFKCSLIFWSSSNEFLINCFLINHMYCIKDTWGGVYILIQKQSPRGIL